MSILSNFQYSLKNDTVFRQKTIFVVSTAVVVILLGVGFIWLNFSPNPSQPQTTPTNNNQPTVTTQTDSEKTQVTTNNFQDTVSFKQVGTQAVAYPESVMISKDEIGFINDQYYFTINDKPVVTPSLYAQSQLEESADGVVINEGGGASIYTNEKKIKGFPDRVVQVTPVLIQNSNQKFNGYYFLEFTDTVINISQATKIDLSDKKVVTPFTISENKSYQKIELRQLGDSVYLFGFENPDEQGSLDIYQIQQGKIDLKKSISKVQSYKYGKNQMIYTDLLPKETELTPYRTNIVDFATPNLDIYVVDISTRLGQDSVFGNIFANRCSFNQTSPDLLYCLVKKNRVQNNTYEEADKLVKIEWKTNKVSYLLQNTIFSGSALYVIDDKTIYFVGQENKLLYKFNNIDNS